MPPCGPLWCAATFLSTAVCLRATELFKVFLQMSPVASSGEAVRHQPAMAKAAKAAKAARDLVLTPAAHQRPPLSRVHLLCKLQASHRHLCPCYRFKRLGQISQPALKLGYGKRYKQYRTCNPIGYSSSASTKSRSSQERAAPCSHFSATRLYFQPSQSLFSTYSFDDAFPRYKIYFEQASQLLHPCFAVERVLPRR